MSLLPTKLLMNWGGIGADHSDVPALVVFSSYYPTLPFKG